MFVRNRLAQEMVFDKLTARNEFDGT